jgi:CheY-like chemotaxis protein
MFNCIELSKISVLLVGDSPHMFSFLRPCLEKLGCECYFARSCQEISELLSDIELHIVFSSNTSQNLADMMRLLESHCLSMFHLVPVENGCWWLPVLRNGEDCLGRSAVNTEEFTHILAEMVLDIHINVRSKGATRIGVV